MKQCYQCFKFYEEEYDICPHCGYAERTPVAEPRYLEPGTILQQRYLVGVAIGAGGFGVTYTAWDKVLEQKVAIKEYLPGEFSTRGSGQTQVTIYGGEKTEQFRKGKEKFHEESKRLAKFRNIPGIVQIFNSFTENGTVYIVMEYLDGETLDTRLKREGRIQEQEAVNIMIPILQALETVHKEGILHRDIAPNNIFLTNDGEVKLLDFGAARSATGSHSKSLTVLYKEGYTPEEQYRSRGDQGPWTDVYACAATLYRMLTGNVPPGALERRRKDTLKEPSKSKIKVSKEVDIAVLNALNVDVKHRTQSAGQFLQELTGKVKGKKHFIRTIEKKVGNLPLGIKLGSGLTVGLAVVFLVLLFTGIIGFDVNSFANLFVEDGKARVINVVNMEEEAAKEKLERIGLVLEVEDIRYSNKVQEGRIITQTEKKGEVVAEGTAVHVVVSKGAGIVEVPDMVGKKWEEVQLQLDELCLEYEVKKMKSIEAPGYVYSQGKKAGSQLEQGETISIVVSEGNDYDSSQEVESRDLIGKVYEEAKQQLSDDGIYLQVLEYQYDDNLEKGTIIQQAIQSGTMLKGGDIQEVIVSAGLEPKEVPELVGISEQEAVDLLEEQQLTASINVVINKEKEEGTVLSQSIKAGEIVDKFSEVSIDVCSHGIDVPNFIGLTYEAAVSRAKESGLQISASYVYGGDGTINSQTPSASSVVDEGSIINVNIGMTQNEFTTQLVASINAKRRDAGLGAVSLASAWNQSASALAASGMTSAQGKDNTSSWSSYLPANRGFTFWASRDGITTVDNMIGRLPFNSEAFLRSDMTVIGVGYSGNRISILIATH